MAEKGKQVARPSLIISRSFAYHLQPTHDPDELEEDHGPVVQEHSAPSAHQADGGRTPMFMHRRNQVDRQRMSARDRSSAHSLLRDFPALRNKPGLEAFRVPDMEAARQREGETGSVEQREEERIEKEVMDGLVAEMDSARTDVDLVAWMNARVFAPSPSTTTSSPTSPRHGFLSEWTDDQVALSSPLPPSTPIHLTSLYPSVLAHLIRRFRVDFLQPHLSLHVHHLSRTVNPPFSTFRASASSSVYAELFQTRWSLHDVEGVLSGLEEMVSLGGEIDGEVRRSLDGIAREVILSDGQRAEAQAERELREEATKQGVPETAPMPVTRSMVEARRRYSVSERRAAEEIERLVTKAWERDQEARARRSPSVGWGWGTVGRQRDQAVV